MIPMAKQLSKAIWVNGSTGQEDLTTSAEINRDVDSLGNATNNAERDTDKGKRIHEWLTKVIEDNKDVYASLMNGIIANDSDATTNFGPSGTDAPALRA
jgi:hypothetical protein